MRLSDLCLWGYQSFLHLRQRERPLGSPRRATTPPLWFNMPTLVVDLAGCDRHVFTVRGRLVSLSLGCPEALS